MPSDFHLLSPCACAIAGVAQSRPAANLAASSAIPLNA